MNLVNIEVATPFAARQLDKIIKNGPNLIPLFKKELSRKISKFATCLENIAMTYSKVLLSSHYTFKDIK